MPTRRELANAVRVLSMDAVQRAASGHPGMPMGMADIAQVLWCDVLRHDPTAPHWPDRDRFVLSNGHGSMLLYSVLHLSGYDLGMEWPTWFEDYDASGVASFNEARAELEKIEDQFFYNAVTGKIDVDTAWDAYLLAWNKAGGEEATADVNKAAGN